MNATDKPHSSSKAAAAAADATEVANVSMHAASEQEMHASLDAAHAAMRPQTDCCAHRHGNTKGNNRSKPRARLVRLR